MKKIRVLITDDHEMVRRGLNTFLRAYPDLELIGEANSGEQAVKLCGELQPDVVLMDLIMAGIGGIEATRQIMTQYPAIRVIALSSAMDSANVTKAIDAGAMGYLMKNIATDDLAAAIRSVYQGQRVLSDEARQAITRAATRPYEPTYRLSEHEYEILHLLIEGLSNPEIATKTNISRATIQYHINNIFNKLGVTNRADAIDVALRNKIQIEQ